MTLMNPTTSAPVIQGDAETLLWRDCFEFVREQSEGEWGDDLITSDANKLYGFVRTRLALGEGEFESEAKHCSDDHAEADRLLRVAGEEMQRIEPDPKWWITGNTAKRAIVKLIREHRKAHPDPLAAGASEEAGADVRETYDGRNLNDWERAVEIASGWYSEDYPDDRDIRIAAKGIEVGRKLQVPVSDDLRSAVCEVLNKAWCLMDNTANENPPEVSQEDWNALSEAMDKLEQLIPKSEQPCWPGVAARLLATQALAALSTPPARPGRESPFVAGPVWQDDECWTSEVQVVGGHAVVLTVHGATEEEVVARRDACLLALFDGASA